MLSLSSEQYKLGSRYLGFGNAGPYIGVLESGRGSMQALRDYATYILNEIMQVYQLNLKQYYDRG